MKFYRKKPDGTIEVAHVRVCKARGKSLFATKPKVTYPFGEAFEPVRERVSVLTYPTPAQASVTMYKDGWTRDKKGLA